MRLQQLKILVAVGCAVALLAGCSSYPKELPAAGPSENAVIAGTEPRAETGIVLVDLTDAIVRKVVESSRRPLLSDTLGMGTVPQFRIAAGDVLEISVWEAPPAVLFGSGAMDPRQGGVASGGSSRVSVLPEQVVGTGGTLNMPFAGSIQAAGRTTQQIEEEITRKLKAKANDPQVMVRLLRNQSSSVTIVGEVNQSQRLSLSPRGERLLDAIAAAGGTKQAIGKVNIQVTREITENGRRVTRVASVPFDAIITDPNQNIVLQPGDVVTALFQPNSITVLGATVRNEEFNFEAQGITLAQALARAGGLNDLRANPQGIFIFRFEDPAVVGVTTPKYTTSDGRIPVVYKLNLRDPAAFFMAQGFPMRNKDTLYVADAPAAELQKFLNLVSSVVIPAVTVRTLGR